MAKQIKHIERIRGRGRLTETGGAAVLGVEYVIDVYQRYIDSIPGMKFMTGKVMDISQGDIAHAMMPAKTLDLELQDGRHVGIILKNLAGDFDAAGAIEENRSAQRVNRAGQQPYRPIYFPAFFAAAAFFALNLAHRFLVASAMRFLPAALSLRFLTGAGFAA